MLENGLSTCSCKSTKCVRHGNCKECIDHHKGREKVPYCKRPENIQAAKKMKELTHIIW